MVSILLYQKNVSWCYTAHLRHFVPLTVFRCSEQYMKKDKTSTLLEIFPSHPTFTANGNTKCDGWIVSQEQQPSSDIDHSRIQFWPSDLLRPDQTELCLSLWWFKMCFQMHKIWLSNESALFSRCLWHCLSQNQLNRLFMKSWSETNMVD